VTEDAPIISKNPDTIYRLYRGLEKKQIISYLKLSRRDYVRPRQVCEYWGKKKDEGFAQFLGKKSGNSEKNPSKAGKKSEHNSEKFPTNNSNYILDNSNYIDKDKEKELFEAKAPTPPQGIFNDPEGKTFKRLNKKRRKHLQLISEVVAYFAERSGRKHAKPYTKGVYDQICKFAEQGYTLEDFKKVIDFKTWYFTEENPKREYINLTTYLRNSKFEANLEAANNREADNNPAEGATDSSYKRFLEYLGDNPQLKPFVPSEQKYVDFVSQDEYTNKVRLQQAVQMVSTKGWTYKGSDFIDIANRENVAA